MIFLLLLSCFEEDLTEQYSNLLVQKATMEDFSLSQAAMIGGFNTISGTLWVTDETNQLHRIPIQGSGPSVGLFFNFSTSNVPEMELHLPKSNIYADELFGEYAGGQEALAIGIMGGQSLHLTNDFGVHIDTNSWVFGVSISTNLISFTLKPKPTDQVDGDLEEALEDPFEEQTDTGEDE